MSLTPVYSLLYPEPGYHTYGGRRIKDIACVTRWSHSDAWVTANKLPRPVNVMLIGWRRNDA